MTLEEINKATDHDKFMTAKEAIEFGLFYNITKGIV